jgi:hypothetical protein
MLSSLIYWVVLGDLRAHAAMVSPRGEEEVTVSWRNEPDGRGTWGILSTCIITMSLCVCTALHLNIAHQQAQHGAHASTRWATITASEGFQKLKWMGIGLFAPEVVVYTAWMQMMRACHTTRILKSQTDNRRCSEWTAYHSWYLLIGGFVFDTQTPTVEEEFIEGCPKLVVSADGMRTLALRAPHLLPPIDKDTIKRLGKSDPVAKAVVCFQALYMIIQCVSRKLQGLPITLLELNTFGHAICALLMYGFWFRKPQDAVHQTVIQGDMVNSWVAAFWFSQSGRGLSSYRKCFLWAENRSLKRDLEPESLDLGSFIFEDDVFRVVGVERVEALLSRYRAINEKLWSSIYGSRIFSGTKVSALRQNKSNGESLQFRLDRLDGCRRAIYGAVIDDDLFAQDNDPHRMPHRAVKSSPVAPNGLSALEHGIFNDTKQPEKTMSNIDHISPDHRLVINLRLFNLLALALPAYECELDRQHEKWLDDCADNHSVKSDPPYELSQFRVWGSVKLRVSNWPETFFSGSGAKESWPSLIIAVVSGAYGGLHALAWYSHFPTTIEQILWRASSFIILGSGVIWGLLSANRCYVVTTHREEWLTSLDRSMRRQRLLVQFLVATLETFWKLANAPSWDLLRPHPSWNSFWRYPYYRWELPSKAFLWAMVIVFVTARAYIIVEAVISLRSLPESAYTTPEWPNWIPHL